MTAAGRPHPVHYLFIFENQEAHIAHAKSDAVKVLKAAYRPGLAGGTVVFTDYAQRAVNS